MKKRNFITGFSAAFVATIALVSCGGVRAKDGVYLTINGKEYYAKDLYNDQKTPAAAEAKFNAVYKVAVRRYFEAGQEGNTYMPEITRETKLKVADAKEEAKNNASKNGTKYDVEWKKILSTNGVDDETGLYNKFEYDLEKSKFEEKIYERKFDGTAGKEGQSNYDVLREGGYLKNYKGEKVETGKGEIPGYLKTKMPYHMKHILVKIAGGKENEDAYTEITSAEAKKLCDVITGLANGTSFDEIASKATINDDETARKNHGSLGIMSRDTEFVNDFKLGTYLFEAFFSRLTNQDITGEEKTKYDPTNAQTELFKDGSVAKDLAEKIVKLEDRTAVNSGVNDVKLGRIPYGVIQQLASQTADGYLYEMDGSNAKTKDRFSAAGVTLSDVKAKYYPRNILFNKYFNKHNVMVITNSIGPTYNYGSVASKDVGESSKYIRTESSVMKKGTGEDNYFNTRGAAMSATSPLGTAGFKSGADIKNKNDVNGFLGFTDSAATPTKENVLCDENGRIVLVFRSGSSGSKSSNDSSGYQGIHFVVIERSPFIGNEYDEYYEQEEIKVRKDKTTLKEYYTQYYPNEIDGHHPQYNGTTVDKRTYVNYIIGEEQSKLKERSNTIKSELKKCDSNLNTYVFEYLMKKGDISFNQSSIEAKALQSTIESWITNTKREYTKKTDTKKWDDTWQTYYDNLELRSENRSYVASKGEKLVPEALVKVFTGESKFVYSDGAAEPKFYEYLLKDVFGKEGAYNE